MARSFDRASSEYLRVDSSPVTNTPFTMACWFYSTDITVEQGLMQLWTSVAAGRYHSLSAAGADSGDPINVYTWLNPASGLAQTSTGFSANTWHHACGVWASATDRRAFIDGSSKGTDTTSVDPGTLNRTNIASLDWTGPGSYLAGRLCEAAIWNIALSDAEVAVLATGAPPPLVRPDALVRYWPLVRTDQDFSGGADLTAFNTPTWGAHAPDVITPWFVPVTWVAVPVAGPTYTLTAASGTLSLSGQATGLEAGRLLTAANGTVSLSGQAAALTAGRSLTAASGTLSLSGQAAGLLVSRALTAAQGTITLAGQAAALNYGYTLIAAQGTISLSGQAAGLAVSRQLTAAQGTLSLSGQAVGLYRGFYVAAAQGTISLTGQAAGLTIARLLTAANGTISLSGQVAGLIYSGSAGYTLTADAGALSLSGQASALLASRLMTAEYGTISLSGQDLALIVMRSIGPIIRAAAAHAPDVRGAYSSTPDARAANTAVPTIRGTKEQ
jgi:hypothetical protein